MALRIHLMPTPANPSPRRYSSSGGHSRRKMNALTFSCIRQPSSSCSPAPGESSSRRCSSQSRWASAKSRLASHGAAPRATQRWIRIDLGVGHFCLSREAGHASKGQGPARRLAEKACGSRKDVSVLSDVTLYLVDLTPITYKLYPGSVGGDTRLGL